MAKKSNLPIDVHEHFRKANILHGYVEKSLGEARSHALEIGQELASAKQAIPHGSWEDECNRLFDGSARTARFYMAFAKDFGKLTKTAASAVLMVEGTLEGTAKAAKRLANPQPAAKPPEQEKEGERDKLGLPCPDCGGDDFFDDGTCRSCPRSGPETEEDIIDAPSEPVREPAGDGVDEEAVEEPEAADEAGTCLKAYVLGAIEDWRERYPDAPGCLVGGILESLAANWKSELED